jgi:hypothetical protein
MLLALGTGICRQRPGIEPIGLPKHGARDVDRIVKGKILDYFDRRVVAGGELVGESHPGCDFDVFGQPFYDFAKSPDLFFGIPAGNQDIGRVPQRLKTAFGGSPGYRLFQIQQKRPWFSHPISSVYFEKTCGLIEIRLH